MIMGNRVCSRRRSDPPEEHPGPVIVKPEVPFRHVIPGGIFVGRLVRVRGIIKDRLNKFELKLQCGYYQDSDVALHIYVRPEDNCLFMNTIDKGNAGEAIAGGPVPLYKGQTFEVYIICDPDAFQIIVNDMFSCEFPHRLPTEDITYIAGDGDMRVTLISFESTKPRQSQIVMGSSSQFSSPGIAVSNQSIRRNVGSQSVLQYRRDSDATNPSQQINEPQQQEVRQVQLDTTFIPETPNNAANGQSPPAYLQRPGISPAPYIISMAGNIPSTHDVSGSNRNAPNSSGMSGTDSNVRR